MSGQLIIQRGVAAGGGGGGTPGGTDTQVQFNDGGAFGGDAGLVFNKTTNRLTVAGELEVQGAAPFELSGDNIGFGYWGIGAPGFTLTTFVLASDGGDTLINAPTAGGAIKFRFANNEYGILRPGGALTLAGGAGDVTILPDTANVLAQRNGTNAQTHRIYGTFTDASNYERLALTTTVGTKVTVAAQTAGTGADNLDLELLPTGTGVVQIGTGLKIAQGAITDPALGLEHTVTWNDAADTFTAWKLNVTNTNSAAASMLLDLHVGGVSMFGARRDGTLIFGTNCSIRNDASNLVLGHSDGQFVDIKTTGGTLRYIRFFGGAAGLGQAVLFGSGPDVGLCRDAANILGVRNDSAACTFRVYGTFTTSSNYERFAVNTTVGTKVTLAAETAGTGADNLDLELLPVGTGVLQISNPVDGAAAATGTLTNAPTAGNPANWLRVKIGANVRFIPAWA